MKTIFKTDDVLRQMICAAAERDADRMRELAEMLEMDTDVDDNGDVELAEMVVALIEKTPEVQGILGERD